MTSCVFVPTLPKVRTLLSSKKIPVLVGSYKHNSILYSLSSNYPSFVYYFPYFLPFLFNKYFFCMPGSCHKHSREEEMILQVQAAEDADAEERRWWLISLSLFFLVVCSILRAIVSRRWSTISPSYALTTRCPTAYRRFKIVPPPHITVAWRT